MRAAVPPPASRDEMVVTLVRAFCEDPALEAIPGGSPNWNRVAALVQAWLLYERSLSKEVVELKLRAEWLRGFLAAKAEDSNSEDISAQERSA